MTSSLSTQALWAKVAARGRGDFLVTPEARLSYFDLGLLIRRWIAFFDANSIAPGERIVIRTSNEIAAISGFLASLLDGVVPVLLTPDTSNTRLISLLDAVEPAAYAGDAGSNPALPSDGLETLELDRKAIAPKRRWSILPETADAVPGLPKEPSQRAPRQPTDGDGLAYILFTSGTTSSPSGVQITRQNLFCNLATQTRVFGYDRQSRIFNDMILAHADGMIQGPVQALAVGGAIIRSGGFSLSNLEHWLGRVRSERATHVITVPTVWSMVDRYAKHNDYFDSPECRALLSVAAKLPEDLWARLENRFGRSVFNQYGLTETVVTALWAGPQEEMGAVGTIGKPIDCEARIEPLSDDGSGELLLRGSNIFPGYWRDVERTGAMFTQAGWLRTGDLVRQRDDHSYEILGRLKTVIMMGGFLIRPDEIDEALMRHPNVRESATVAFDDEIFGEVPISAVVLEGSGMPETELIDHARSLLEAQKVPKRIVVLEAIPRGPSGKPQHDTLRSIIGSVIGDNRASVPDEAAPALADAVLGLAAELFRVDGAILRPESGPDSVAGWDSFSHLNFIMAAEQHFGITIPAARVATISTIRDMIRTVSDLQA